MRLCDEGGDPILQEPALIESNICEGDAHAEAIVHINDFGFALECAAVSDNADVDERAIGEWTGRCNVTAAEADFGNARGKPALRVALGYFRGGDELAARHGARFFRRSRTFRRKPRRC